MSVCVAAVGGPGLAAGWLWMLCCVLDEIFCSCTCPVLACYLAFPSCGVLLLLHACRWNAGQLLVSPWCLVLLVGDGIRGAAGEGCRSAPGSPVVRWVLCHGV